MALDLFTISLSQKSQGLLKRLDKFGIGDSARKVAGNAIQGVTQLCLKGAKSKVPIDTLELRGQGLDTGYIRQSFSLQNLEGSVYVSEAIHYGRDGKPFKSEEYPSNASGLAQLLDNKDLHRSRKSANIDDFGSESGSTSDWIGKADRAVRQKLGKYLQSTDFSNGF